MSTYLSSHPAADGSPPEALQPRITFPRGLRVGVSNSGRLLNSIGICAAILIPALILSSACRHWFVIPLLVCGVICCQDGLRLFEGNGRELFSPLPMLGVFGLYFFYLAPLLHVAFDYWFIGESFSPSGQPGDWRTWIGLMGAVNVVGLVLYQQIQRRLTASLSARRLKTNWVIDKGALRVWGPILLAVCFLLQAYIYYHFDGITGFIAAFNDRTRGSAQFQGLGWLMCIGESFPVMLLIFWAANSRKWGALKTVFVFPALFGLVLLFGGLRGSRSNSVYAMLFAAGIIHLTVRRLSWRTLALLAAAMIPFMYFYGFYKVSQETFLDATSSVDSLADEGQRTGRTFDSVLLGDLDRADVQAYMLYQLAGNSDDIEFAYGRTYTDAVLTFIPHALFPDRPPGKLKYGTDFFFGNGTYSPEGLVSTKIYGVAGEGMLNWGIPGAFMGFVAIGLMTGWAQSFARRLPPFDTRQFLLPIVAIMCVVALSNDFDNVIYVFARQAMMPFIMVWAGSRRIVARSRV
jgi:hypothetical protein